MGGTNSRGGRGASHALALHLGVTWFVWGTSYAALRASLEPWPPFVVAGLRFMIAGGLLLALAARRKRLGLDWRLVRRVWPIAFWLVALGDGLLVWGAQFLPSGQVAVLVATSPLWFVLACWSRGERPSPSTWAALVVGLLGVGWIASAGGEGPREVASDGLLRLGATISCLLAAMAWAWGSLKLRRLDLDLPLGASTGISLTVGGFMLVIAGVLRGEFAALTLEPLFGPAGLAIAYLIVGCSALGFWSYGWLVRHSAPALAGSFAYVNPVIALLSGYLLYDEPLGAQVGVGTLLVLLSLTFAGLGSDGGEKRSRQLRSPA